MKVSQTKWLGKTHFCVTSLIQAKNATVGVGGQFSTLILMLFFPPCNPEREACCLPAVLFFIDGCGEGNADRLGF
jgi:hypothetical protein